MHLPPDFAVSEIDLPNFHAVSPGIYRGGQPSDMGFAWLKQLGVRTILNLREEKSQIRSEELIVLELGMKYVSVVLNPFIEPSEEQIQSCLDVLLAAGDEPVFVHCLHGMDRTGTVIGAHRMVAEDWEKERAYEEMLKHGFHAEFANLTRAIEGIASRVARAKSVPVSELEI
ncbi:MAG TPA: dual specificity protein phosphatase family protein [Planktothrix sp.]|jgi:protein tyrosine/serine phosphatase